MGEQLILTHENTDFDALASQLAVWKLYPQATPVLPRRPNRNLRDFLTLYWDELPYLRYEDLPRRVDVDRIFLVDTQTLVTPRGMTDDTEVQVIDHHPLSRKLPPNWSYTGEEVGATTTLLVERLAATHHALTPVEATLLTLGIYEDTGSLTYPTTTARDLRCAAWLAEQGANLAVVSEFLHHGLTDQQLALYDALLDSAEVIDVAGHTIVITTATAEGYVEEISTLAHKIRDLYDPAGLFLIVDLGDYLQLVGRSTTDAVDVGHIATHFGGGGHTRAAAALIRGQEISDARIELIDQLDQHIRPSVTVRQIMSYGVQTLSPEATVDEAAEEMLRYGFEGFPVVDATGHILGVLTRREIDRARRLHLGNMPVSHYMTKGDISVTPDDSVERLQQVMTQHSVGQVPVVSNDEIIGVVTRTDLIKLWATPTHPPPRRREIAQRIETALPTALADLLRLASGLAQEMGYPLYVVGGFVRDLLLGEPNLDMDLVVEGDAIRLARRVARQIGARTRSHRRFGTAKIILEGREGEFGVPSLDFATARLEFYAHSAALPQVESGSIKADLHRRDFTINTLAIRLDSDHYGRLLDFYGGEEDLRNGLIQVLHSLSFIEDPTRIMRAARFEQRLGFQIEARTAELIENALPMLSRVSAERLRHELYLIFAETRPERVLQRLDELDVLSQIHPSLSCTPDTCQRFSALRDVVAEGTWDIRRNESGAPAPGLYLAVWVCDLARKDVEALASQIKPFRQDLDLLREVSHLRSRIEQLAQPDLTNAEIYALLHRTGSEARLVTWLCADSERGRARLLLYETELRHVEPIVDGTYLKSLGLKPSPLFGELLDAVRDARLDGQIATEQEEKALIARRLAKHGEGV
ncbi:MAG: CBS domain-containing protein [Anaerolineae bacterium]|nr:CBS domain-containing protein [Anaerolineae bacterium]